MMLLIRFQDQYFTHLEFWKMAWPYLIKVKWSSDCILLLISPSYIKLLILTRGCVACGVFEKHPSSFLPNVPALWSQPHLTGSYKKQQEKSSICFFPLRLHQTHIRETLCNMFALVPCPERAHGAQRWVFLSPCLSEGGPAASLGYSPTLDLAQPHPGLPTPSSTRPILTSLVKAERSWKEGIHRPSKATSCRWQLSDWDQIRSCRSRWDQHKSTFFHRHCITWAAGT